MAPTWWRVGKGDLILHRPMIDAVEESTNEYRHRREELPPEHPVAVKFEEPRQRHQCAHANHVRKAGQHHGKKDGEWPGPRSCEKQSGEFAEQMNLLSRGTSCHFLRLKSIFWTARNLEKTAPAGRLLASYGNPTIAQFGNDKSILFY